MATSFEDLGVSPWLVRQANAVGLKVPTPVQENCIPEILKGRDCVGCAKTGSGKTAAFALPILQKLAEDPYGIYCVVLTAVRELAYQIADLFQVLGKPLNLRVSVVVGGKDMLPQSQELARRPHIVIATPGRLAYHLKYTDTCNLRRVQYLVLDEADRVLDETMEQDVTAILAALPKKRHTMLFSATIDDLLDDVDSLSSGQKPFIYVGDSTEATITTLKQEYVLCPKLVRDVYLVYVAHDLHDGIKTSIMVFAATCKNCQVLCMLFNHLGIPAVALHSLMSQNGRLSSLSKFKGGAVRVLVATDVASRGLDIPLVDVVLNSNTPASATDYIHRVGRTARAGRGGRAITFVTQFDVDRVHAIEERIGKKLDTLEMDDDNVNKLLDAVTLSRRQMELDLEKTDFGEQRQRQKEKWETLEAEEEGDKETKKRKKKRKRKSDSAAEGEDTNTTSDEDSQAEVADTDEAQSSRLSPKKKKKPAAAAKAGQRRVAKLQATPSQSPAKAPGKRKISKKAAR